MSEGKKPWEECACSVRNDQGWYFVQRCAFHESAPALLEALKEMAGIIACSHDSDFYCDERNTGERFCECAPCKAHAKARAAIAQAEKGAGE